MLTKTIPYNRRLSLMGVISVSFFMTAIPSHANSGAVERASLFDDATSICYSTPLKPYFETSSGFPEFDEVARPRLGSINAVLYGYGRILTPSLKPKWSDVITGANLKWKRLCKTRIPKGAIAYDRTGRWMVDPDYNNPNAQSYPRHELSNSYTIKSRYWFVGEDLIHIEVRAKAK